MFVRGDSRSLHPERCGESSETSGVWVRTSDLGWTYTGKGKVLEVLISESGGGREGRTPSTLVRGLTEPKVGPEGTGLSGRGVGSLEEEGSRESERGPGRTVGARGSLDSTGQGPRRVRTL